MKVLVINGPNLGRLGSRQPAIYGRTTLAEVEEQLREQAGAMGAEVGCVQFDTEAEVVAAVRGAQADAIIINPAALTHHSRALADAVRACPVPVYEVHISNIEAREPYRRRSLITPHARGKIVGLGVGGYLLALQAAIEEAQP